jgi:hypothetical protein
MRSIIDGFPVSPVIDQVLVVRENPCYTVGFRDMLA